VELPRERVYDLRILERFLNSYLNSTEHKDKRQQAEIFRQEHDA